VGAGEAVLALQEATKAFASGLFQSEHTQPFSTNVVMRLTIPLTLDFHDVVDANLSSENHIPQGTYTLM